MGRESLGREKYKATGMVQVQAVPFFGQNSPVLGHGALGRVSRSCCFPLPCLLSPKCEIPPRAGQGRAGDDFCGAGRQKIGCGSPAGELGNRWFWLRCFNWGFPSEMQTGFIWSGGFGGCDLPIGAGGELRKVPTGSFWPSGHRCWLLPSPCSSGAILGSDKTPVSNQALASKHAFL